MLTHLATGFKVADFRSEESGKTAGDYLHTVYAEEFAALDDSIEPSMSWEQYKTLPCVKTLNSKIQADTFFNSLLTMFESNTMKKNFSADY